MGEGYDAIVVGEVHGDPTIKEREHKLVREERPEYLLKEKLDQYDAADVAPLLERGTYFETVDDARSFFDQRHDNGSYLPVNGEVPQDQIIYDMPVDNLDTIINAVDDLPAEDGEAYADLMELQVFYEQARNNQRSPFADHRPLWTAAVDLRQQGYEVGVAGCDVDKAPMLEQMDAVDTRMEREVLLEEHMGELAEREQVMADRIAAYMDRRSSDRPVVAVVGSLHLFDGNVLEPRLDEHGIDFDVEQLGPSNCSEFLAYKDDAAAYTDYILSDQRIAHALQQRQYIDALEPL